MAARLPIIMPPSRARERAEPRCVVSEHRAPSASEHTRIEQAMSQQRDSQRGGPTPHPRRPPPLPAVEPQPEPNGTTLLPLVTVPTQACTTVTGEVPINFLLQRGHGINKDGGAPLQTQPSDQPACPICLDDMVAPQMLGCGHLYCTKCIATHASVQQAARRPVNCPCCLHPVAPAELHAWASPPQQPRTLGGVPRGVRAPPPARTPAPSWNDAVAGYAASISAAEAVEAAASSSTVEAPALSRREQRAFRRAAARLELRRCPSCDAAVQKTGGCNNMSCLCGASFQWSRATPLVACRTYHYDSNERRYCCPHCLPAAYAKLGAVRVARAAAIVPAATVAATVAGAVVVAGGSVAAAVAVVPAAVFGPLALVYEPIRRTTWLKKHRNGLKMAAASGAMVARYLMCGNDSDDSH